jgi:hypothetical protein
MALALGALMVFLSKLSIRGVARTPEAGGPRN